MQREYPDKSIGFIRCNAEDDLVAMQTQQIWPGNDAWTFSDLTHKVRYVNIGIPFSKSPKNQQTPIKCTDSIAISANYLTGFSYQITPRPLLSGP
jgi:hypothetical protein